eukprot:TRINITY_DN35883_c0_g1_i1.p1 TRINITY_DN35883_c0_g1~~TRINITY_DN35883_c0_g1_i1.p1  ORF type:complete len:1040 (+),score=255.96 TRINITY_DN35883_c0_g1_i1:76-3195(+)
MGGCCAAQKSLTGQTNSVRSTPQSDARSVHRTASEDAYRTGPSVMELQAPESTAKPLAFDAAGEDVRRLLDLFVDIFCGEKREIDERIPKQESACRRTFYVELVLAVRALAHQLCEGDGRELGISLVPSQVAELLIAARSKAARELAEPSAGGLLSVPQSQKMRQKMEEELPADRRRKSLWRKRRVLMRAWMERCMKERQSSLPPVMAAEIASNVDWRIPIKHFIEQGKALAGRLTYDAFLRAHRSARAAALQPLVSWFGESARQGWSMDADEFESLFNAHFGADNQHLLKEVFQTLRGEDDEQAAQPGPATPATYFHHRLTYDGLDRVHRAWTIREFAAFFTDPICNPCLCPRRTSEVYQDMERPLHDFYISASRNSWLSGSERLTSDSSPETLRQLLLSGCRFIELDCHDGPPDPLTGSTGEPEVYLAWTKSGRVKLRDCIRVIAESAFQNNEYPVILSLDFHFGMQPDSAKQMASVAPILEEALGSRLAKWDSDGCLQCPPPSERCTVAALRGKVLVQTEKRAQEISKSTRQDTPFTPAEVVSARVHFGTPPHPEQASLGVSVVDIACRKAVLVVSVAAGSAAARAGIREESYIEAMTVGDKVVPICCKEDLRRTVRGCEVGDEVKVRVNQDEVRVILLEKVEPTPQSPTSGLSPMEDTTSPGRDEDGQPAARVHTLTRRQSRQSMRRYSGASPRVPGGSRRGTHSDPYRASLTQAPACSDDTSDDSDDGLPEVQKRWKRDQIDAWERQGRAYQRIPVVREMSLLSFLVPRRKSSYQAQNLNESGLFNLGDIKYAGLWWEVMYLPQSQCERLWASSEAGALAGRNRSSLTHCVPRRDEHSNNLDPLPVWQMGVQLVAMNHQKTDANLSLYLSKFKDNGGCGYVLKPERLRGVGVPNVLRTTDCGPASTFAVTVVSGLRLYRRSVCGDDEHFAPHVTASVRGLRRKSPGEDDDCREPQSSPASELCTWQHTWKFELRCPDMATLCLSASCHRGGREVILGEAMLPVHLTVPGGVRVVKLQCPRSGGDGGLLLCRFER